MKKKKIQIAYLISFIFAVVALVFDYKMFNGLHLKWIFLCEVCVNLVLSILYTCKKDYWSEKRIEKYKEKIQKPSYIVWILTKGALSFGAILVLYFIYFNSNAKVATEMLQHTLDNMNPTVKEEILSNVDITESKITAYGNIAPVCTANAITTTLSITDSVTSLAEYIQEKTSGDVTEEIVDNYKMIDYAEFYNQSVISDKSVNIYMDLNTAIDMIVKNPNKENQEFASTLMDDISQQVNDLVQLLYILSVVFAIALFWVVWGLNSFVIDVLQMVMFKKIERNKICNY